MKKVCHSRVVACVCSVLFACDYPVVPITPNSDSNTRMFKLKALVPNDDTAPDNFVEFEDDGKYNHFSLCCAEACCSVVPTVVLELHQDETGYLGQLEIEGNLRIIANPESTLYGHYIGSGVRDECEYEFNGQVTVLQSSGKFRAVNRDLNLCIQGIFKEQNRECTAYQVLISGLYYIH